MSARNCLLGLIWFDFHIKIILHFEWQNFPNLRAGLLRLDRWLESCLSMITIVMVKKILTDPAVCLENFQSKYNNDFKLTVGFDPTNEPFSSLSIYFVTCMNYKWVSHCLTRISCVAPLSNVNGNRRRRNLFLHFITINLNRVTINVFSLLGSAISSGHRNCWKISIPKYPFGGIIYKII